MKKIVSNVLIVATQLIIGGLFLFMLFSDSNEDNKVVVVENDNLNKMADTVSELFIVEESNKELVDESAEEDLITEEERKAQEEEAARIAAEEALKAEEEEKAQSTVVNDDVASLQAFAYDLVINSYGWSESDYTALVELWNRESGWNVYAYNAYSGAYGIPQALPASKMGSYGDDYMTNGETQIRWGLAYISSSYGNPTEALNHLYNSGWY